VKVTVHVALVYRRFSADGGTGRFGMALAREALAKGHRVTVVTTHSELDESLLPHLASGALSLVQIALPPMPAIAAMLAFAFRSRRAVALSRAEVSIALGRVPGLDVFRAGGGCHASYLDTVPFWWLSPRAWIELCLDRACAGRARCVIANAPMSLEQLVRRYGIPRERTALVPNGVDVSLFRPDPVARASVRTELGLSPSEPVAIFLGEGFGRKGLRTAVQAVARLDLPLVLVGRGAERAAAGTGRRHGARVIGVGHRQDPERYLAAADVLVLPTRYDSAANAILEAMATGVPPVTSAANGASAFLPRPELCVADPEDVDGFSRAIRFAFEYPGLRDVCRERALQMSWERCATSILDLLMEVREQKAANGRQLRSLTE
jgi:UDP-glucose:(heptosyl)LPS alpha-1,3-glucosyltransferase